jgi:two-component system response regulator AtoC
VSMNVLIVDDEPGLRNGLAKLLTLEGYAALEAASAAEVRKILLTHEIHLMLLDLRLGEQDGLALLREVKMEEPALPVIIITGHGDIYSAVECMKAGATNYIPKPIDHGLLLSIVQKESIALRDRLATLGFRESLRSAARTRLVPSSSAEMKEIERIVEKVRDSDVPVLLLGETGTGKEVIAKIIHYTGAYCDRPFVGLNCASLNENLLESELFGHEKGAFSGAIARKIGRFELAGTGTLFLDEIGDMSLSMQSKLLRVLQERTLERVGGTKPVSVYCRLIAATNKDLAALRSRGEFREDLYYRLSTVTLKLPPLRDRTRDIPALVRTFVEEANAAYGRNVTSIPDRIMRSLTTHSWPGNIRQLKNVIANAVILSDGEEISGLEYGDAGRAEEEILIDKDLPSTVARYSSEIEKKIIRAVLEKNQGNITKSATRLGISRKTLYEKIRRHELWQQTPGVLEVEDQ